MNLLIIVWIWIHRMTVACIKALPNSINQWQTPRYNRCAWHRKPIASQQRFYAQPKPHWVRDEVIQLKALMPQAGCRTIAHHFNRRWAARRAMTVSKTYVADMCRQHQYLIYEARRKLKHRIPRPIPRNRIWGCDLLTKTDRRGQPHLALAIVDHASRACLRLQQVPDKSSMRLLQELVQAVKQYGRPQYLRTDNESVLTSRWFRWGLWMLGIRHQRIEPGCPWQEWAGRTIHRDGEAGVGVGLDCGRGRFQQRLAGHSRLVQPRPPTRSFTGSDTRGSLGRDRCLRRATSDTDGHSRSECASGIWITTGRVGRN